MGLSYIGTHEDSPKLKGMHSDFTPTNQPTVALTNSFPTPNTLKRWGKRVMEKLLRSSQQLNMSLKCSFIIRFKLAVYTMTIYCWIVHSFNMFIWICIENIIGKGSLHNQKVGHFYLNAYYCSVSTNSLIHLLHVHTSCIQKFDQNAVHLCVSLMNLVHSMQLHRRCNYK